MTERLRIMIVDDEPQIVELMSNILRRDGYAVVFITHKLAEVLAGVAALLGFGASSCQATAWRGLCMLEG